ncbi:uncharacterized protein EHS24_007726 [Apiotrichum porosum]|uniref:Ribosome biogenesis protein NSA1 n=1 Tax=Apiotrichum porosum TaxID=105984 RepID=A0A427XV72_9TREE|nr:uncharacterized protein EHS24_007726 [Apiotrichum porosum]RSH82732.1 hypothetical protein EHS24_007726 [Apiotrichum porosum]
MAAYRTVDFWAPALYANTIEEVAVPEPGPSRDPIVRHLPIKYGEFESVGVIKRMAAVNGGLLVADDQYRISALSLPSPDDETAVPLVTSQTAIPVPKAGSQWTGLAALGEGAISSLASGRVSLFSSGADVSGTLKVGRPVLTLSTPSGPGVGGSNTFALAGKEVEISVWDATRAFSATPSSTSATAAAANKRKKDDLAPGEVWRAKNVAHNSLQIRQPVHHLCSSFLPNSTTDIVTGTKAGNVRRYDTRQRKPVGDWKAAREGGVGAVIPGANEHELFFADHSSLTAAMDLRTGRMLYAVPGVAASAAFMLALPTPSPAFSRTAGLATISSDATLRVCATTPPALHPSKGNASVTPGKKGSVVGAVGGVGVGSFVFRGFGSHRDVVPPKPEGEDAEEEDYDEDAEVGEEEEEEIWGGMGEAEAGDSEDEDDDDDEEDDDEDEEMDSESESEDEAPKKKKGRK